MVRINLISPKQLADQHLIAEYNEMLMLLGYVKKYPEPKNIPKEYCLGKGHILFFKDKLKYIKKRHELIKREMLARKFKPIKTIKLTQFNTKLLNDWKPTKKDLEIIKERILWKLDKKPRFYTYYKEHKSLRYLKELIENA